MKKLIFLGILFIVIIGFFFLREGGGAGPNVSQNGISPSKLADDIFDKYDRNKDDKLDVASESFLRLEKDGVLKTESRGLLFTHADDFGNNDGVVSEIELENFIMEFDTDGDGEITTFKNIFHSMFNPKSEWRYFDEKYTEKFKYQQVDE